MRALLAVLVVILAIGLLGDAAQAQSPNPQPSNTLGTSSDADIWRQIRQGQTGMVPGGNPAAGVMIQSDGERWRLFRNGPVITYGLWGLGGIILLCAIFYVLRGRIQIEQGWSGRFVVRFDAFERFIHWLAAISFVILGLTGLNLLYGKMFLLPIMGHEAFATLTLYGKLAHNYVAFAFMLALILIFLRWVLQNLPTHHDVIWILKGGGMFSSHGHVPAKKFNAGQKVIFWLVILGGASVSLSGISLMFPFQMTLWADTFALLNSIGFNLPTDISPMQEMQLSQTWHTVVGLVLIALIIAHIYIATIGMEGAFSAMGTGKVDVNWAKEHHALWYEKVKGGDAD